MEILPRKFHVRDGISLLAVIAAIGFGPALLAVVHAGGMVFGEAGIFAFICFIFVVPLLTLAAGRYKYWAWQIAIISVVVAVIQDNFRLNAMNRSEVPRVAFMFWGVGTLFSAPVPVYFFFRSLAPRQQLIFGVLVAAISIAIGLEIKHIAG